MRIASLEAMVNNLADRLKKIEVELIGIRSHQHYQESDREGSKWKHKTCSPLYPLRKEEEEEPEEEEEE
jgi:hypothetical protein